MVMSKECMFTTSVAWVCSGSQSRGTRNIVVRDVAARLFIHDGRHDAGTNQVAYSPRTYWTVDSRMAWPQGHLASILVSLRLPGRLAPR
jgi:hypothetical protein